MSDFQCHRNNREASRPTPKKPAMPEFYMPAMWPTELIGAIFERFRAWRRRRQFLRLLALDDHQLDDLGYKRGDILHGSLPASRKGTTSVTGSRSHADSP